MTIGKGNHYSLEKEINEHPSATVSYIFSETQ